MLEFVKSAFHSRHIFLSNNISTCNRAVWGLVRNTFHC